jgi:hypothetical protein
VLTFLVFFSPVLVAACAVLWQQRRRLQREVFIRNHDLPRGLFDNLRKRRPELSLKDCQLTANALRQFFLAYLMSGRKYVSMPSQVADDLWHEFILFTRHYDAFCRGAFGGFLHHTPAVSVGASSKADGGLHTTWWHACKEDHINPRAPTRLPLLFALDTKLGVADGFSYALDCKTALVTRATASATAVPVIYCGGDFAAAAKSRRDKGSGGDGGCGGGDNGGDSGCGGGGCGGD